MMSGERPTFSSLMNHERFAGGWDCQEVQRAERVSPIWYFSLIPVIRGFSSGKSEEFLSELETLQSQLTNYLHVS